MKKIAARAELACVAVAILGLPSAKSKHLRISERGWTLIMRFVHERDGLFMLAFADPADAVTWAVLLQLALLRYLVLVSLLVTRCYAPRKAARGMFLEPESVLNIALQVCLEDQSA